jgi:hypothetical protein
MLYWRGGPGKVQSPASTSAGKSPLVIVVVATSSASGVRRVFPRNETLPPNEKDKQTIMSDIEAQYFLGYSFSKSNF